MKVQKYSTFTAPKVRWWYNYILAMNIATNCDEKVIAVLTWWPSHLKCDENSLHFKCSFHCTFNYSVITVTIRVTEETRNEMKSFWTKVWRGYILADEVSDLTLVSLWRKNMWWKWKRKCSNGFLFSDAVLRKIKEICSLCFSIIRAKGP